MIKKGVVADIAILCNHLPGGLLPDRVLVHTGDRNEVVSFLLKQRKEKTIKQKWSRLCMKTGTLFYICL